MKLTQKWMNGICDYYDQNWNKNKSQCDQATTKSSRISKETTQQHKTRKR